MVVKEKDRQLVELRREVNNVIDKKKRLEQELDRLKHHLVEVEDGYTQEAISSEDRERELRKKLQVSKYLGNSVCNHFYLPFEFQVTEEALRVASQQQSNTTKVATAHLQRLESQVKEFQLERDSMYEKWQRISQEYTMQSKAMANLNAALEGLQTEKENEKKWAEKDYQER